MKLNLSVLFPCGINSSLVLLQVSHVLAAGRQLAVGPDKWSLQFTRTFPFSQFLFFLASRLRLFSDADRQIMRLELNQYGKPLTVDCLQPQRSPAMVHSGKDSEHLASSRWNGTTDNSKTVTQITEGSPDTISLSQSLPYILHGAPCANSTAALVTG